MKLRSLACLSLLLITLFTTVEYASAQVPCDGTIIPQRTLSINWPLVRFDPAHTGCNPYESILSPSNVANLTVKWAHDFVRSVNSNPVVANGMVYVGGADNSMYALNANTGDVVWKFFTGGYEYSSAAVANGVVYAVGSNNLYALNARTGDLLWAYTTGGTVQSYPTVVNGVVYFGSGDGSVYALNAGTGDLIWKNATPGEEVDTSPTVANGIVYIASIHNSYAFNASTGDLIWTLPAFFPDTAAVANGVVYYFSGQDYLHQDLYLYALNANTGDLIWKLPLTWWAYSPAVANGVVYLATLRDGIYALNASTGAQIWHKTGIPFSSAPSVANGVVYIGSTDSNDSYLYAFDAATGTVLWQYSTAAWETRNSAAAVVNGVVYIGSENGNLYAFHLPGH
jgi:eukaryotic-like serine/threonine-protein kinase